MAESFTVSVRSKNSVPRRRAGVFCPQDKPAVVVVTQEQLDALNADALIDCKVLSEAEAKMALAAIEVTPAARIAQLEAELAEAKAQLESLTAPSAPGASGDAPAAPGGKKR